MLSRTRTHHWISVITLSAALLAAGCTEERKVPNQPNQGRDAGLPFIDSGTPSLQLVVDPVSLALTEGGAAGTFTIKLSDRPASDVTVQIGSSDLEALQVTPDSLVFSEASFDQAQPITVAPLDDPDANAESITLTVTAAGLAPVSVQIRIADDDAQQIVASLTMLGVNEGGTATVAVSLAAQPDGAVMLAVGSDTPATIGVAPASLSFDAATWDQPHLVTISGLDDADADDATGSVTLSSAGLPSVPIAVTVFDDDRLAILVDPTTVMLAEGGNTATVQVSLTSRPDSDVTVNVSAWRCRRSPRCRSTWRLWTPAR